MALSKIQAESMNLADTYAFTGDVTGAGGGIFESQLLHVRDEKAQGTDGGASISGDNTRDLNTVVTNEITGASLSSNQITLPSGTYYINASTSGYKVNEQVLFLYNTTDSQTELKGQNSDADDPNNEQTRANVIGRFTLSGTKVLELRHYTSRAHSPDGLGQNVNQTTEIYTDVQIWKVS